MTVVCAMDNCGGRVKARGLCNRHYMHLYNRGQLDVDPILNKYDRFNTSWEPEPNSGCWLWTGVTIVTQADRGSLEYGRFHMHGVGWFAHRASWTLNRGVIPPKMFVLHKCDNTLCVNPGHLFLGTHQDNMEDMKSKGRGSKTRGSEISSSKLTDDQVSAILNDPRKVTDIAKSFGVSHALISNIKSGSGWKHIGGARHERPALCKLTETQVIAIKADPRGNTEVAREYGISDSHVCKIRRGIKWKSVDNLDHLPWRPAGSVTKAIAGGAINERA